MPETVYIVGKLLSRYDPSQWEFQGVFDTESAAVDACLDEWHFVGPATMNVELPQDRETWPGSYFPKYVEDEE